MENNMENTLHNKNRRGRPPVYEKPLVTVTCTMTEERKHKLKLYALEHRKTVSQVLAEFVDTLEV